MKRYQSEREKVHQYVEDRLALGDFDRVSDVLADIKRHFRWEPSRSTFYAWVKSWRDAQGDGSGLWTLAKDRTGRPDVVMRVIAAIYENSQGRRGTVTVDQARWLVKLAAALPAEWPDEHRAMVRSDGTPMILTIPGALRLLGSANRHLSAEKHYGDEIELMAQTDLMTAIEWWSPEETGKD